MHFARLPAIERQDVKVDVGGQRSKIMQIKALERQRDWGASYRFGGVFGFGTPVVSYAPRPMFIVCAVLLKGIKALGNLFVLEWDIV